LQILFFFQKSTKQATIWFIGQKQKKRVSLQENLEWDAE
jgi:hypothetical protein